MSATVRKIIYWNGKDLPPGFSSLPVGLYAIESHEDLGLTPDALAELDASAAAIERGEGVSLDAVSRELKQTVAAARTAKW